jgi:hypothetical protein
MYYAYQKQGRDHDTYCIKCFFKECDSFANWVGAWSPEYYAFYDRYDRVEVGLQSLTCRVCYREIHDIPESFVEQRPSSCKKKKKGPPGWGKSKYKADTKRKNAAGKWIGGHHKRYFGWSLHGGKYYRNRLNRAERQYYKRYALAYESDPEFEPRVSTGSLIYNHSIVSWKGW